MEKKELLEKIKKENKKQAIKRVSMTEEEQKLNRECLEAASSPNKFTNDDFELGSQELDIRELSKENTTQMFFRLLATQTGQIRAITQCLIDVERLLMLLLETNGIKPEEIGTKINNLIEKLTKESEKITRQSQKAAA